MMRERDSLDKGRLYEGAELRPSDIWPARYVTPYIYPRRSIDSNHPEGDLAERLEGRLIMGTPQQLAFADRRPPSGVVRVPESIEEKRARELKHRRKVMLRKVYGTPEGLEVPPHRDAETLEAIFDSNKRESDDEPVGARRGWAELHVRLPWKPPYEVPKRFPYHLKRLRRESEWIAARQKEDRVFLFGDEELDETNRGVGEMEEPMERKLGRWADIREGRYFWDFVQHYPRTGPTSMSSSVFVEGDGAAAAPQTRRDEGRRRSSLPHHSSFSCSDEPWLSETMQHESTTAEGKQDLIREPPTHLPSIFPFGVPEHK